MADRIHLSFTVGPVQRFVAQARRTRDLWAGSWLLSYLTECALAAAEEAGGTAVIPHRTESERRRVTSVRKVIGGIPNRFELVFDTEVEATVAADRATKAYCEAWKTVADAVWEEFVTPVAAQGQDTEAIWRRQVDTFWELSWVIAQPSDDQQTLAYLAAARKQYRNIPATEESGTKCSLMANMQEISGHGPGNKQRDFWLALAQKAGEHDFTVVLDRHGSKRVNERLCAIALIKRLFPHVIEQALGEHAKHAAIQQLRAQTGWPSTAFFAALPWLRDLKGDAQEQAKVFAEEAAKAAKAKIGKSERQSARDMNIPWANIDAPAWFANALRQYEWKDKEEELRDLTKRLNSLCESAGAVPIPYYALLLMDGDSMGALLDKLHQPRKLSECLANFANKVEEVVKHHHCRTIYAGGDDVLAMLPAKTAFDAADQLAQKYSESFDGTKAANDATLSGAIVFAHWKFPLRQVLATAHHLLDDIAKDRTGRDSLAIGILQGSGLSAVWSAPWEVVRGEKDGAPNLAEFLDRFSSDDTDRESARFNASYLYHLREQFRRLFPEFREEPGIYARFEGDESMLLDIAHAEYRRRMSKEQQSKQQHDAARPEINQLMALSRRWTRVPDGNGAFEPHCEEHSFGFDGWRVARFLKQIQDGRMTSHE